MPRLIDPWFEARFYGEVARQSLRMAHEDGSRLSYAQAQGLFLWCPCGYGALEETATFLLRYHGEYNSHAKGCTCPFCYKYEAARKE